MRQWVGVAFIAVQVAWVLIVHLSGTPSRYFVWAPFDYMVSYQIRVTDDGHDFTPAEIQARYGVPEQDVYEGPAQDIEDVVRQYEQTYGRSDHAYVTYTYQVNGGPQQVWSWP